VFEALLIGDCRLFRSLAENYPLLLLGFLQQYLPTTEVALSTAIARVVLESASPIKRACRDSQVRRQLDRVTWACEAKAASDISDC
jgi:hypothetical protein